MKKFTLKALRTNAGLLQKEVAKKLGKSEKTIGNWENGVSFPKPEDIDAICELYGVHYDVINFCPSDSLKANRGVESAT